MSAAINAAMDKANATDYVRKYGPDETYWTHFLDHLSGSDKPRSTDYTFAADLIESKNPEATGHIGHLRTMAQILSYRG
jgi:hypothetical protein